MSVYRGFRVTFIIWRAGSWDFRMQRSYFYMSWKNLQFAAYISANYTGKKYSQQNSVLCDKNQLNVQHNRGRVKNSKPALIVRWEYAFFPLHFHKRWILQYKTYSMRRTLWKNTVMQKNGTKGCEKYGTFIFCHF